MMQTQPQYEYAPQAVLYGPPVLRPEVPLLAEQGVQVTSARFVVYQQTYPINGITTIAPFSIPAHIGKPILLGLLGLVVLIASFDSGGAGPVIGFLLFIAAIGWLTQCKATHGVMITTSGMNVRVLTSNDIALVHRVVTALNHAVAMR